METTERSERLTSRRSFLLEGRGAERERTLGLEPSIGGKRMRWFIGFNRLLLVGVVAAAAVLSLTQVAQAGPPPPVVPGEI